MGKEPGTQMKCWEICAGSLGSAKGKLQSHDYLWTPKPMQNEGVKKP